MTVITNNMTKGCIDAMAKGPGSGFVPAGVTNIGQGNPDNIVTAQTGSDIFWDSATNLIFDDLNYQGSLVWNVEAFNTVTIPRGFHDIHFKNISDGGYVQVLVNGLPVSVGDGKKDKACFFSRDGIVAAKLKNITASMYMYWVGSIAGYELKRTDRIDFIYLHI